jgi:hypothetical protein
MAEWFIRIIGKQRQEVDKDLLVQAVLALGRQLWEEEQARRKRETPGPPSSEEDAT